MPNWVVRYTPLRSPRKSGQEQRGLAFESIGGTPSPSPYRHGEGNSNARRKRPSIQQHWAREGRAENAGLNPRQAQGFGCRNGLHRQVCFA